MKGAAAIARRLATDTSVVVSRQGAPTLASLDRTTRASFSAPERRVELQPFATGSLGNFPYYWQDPRTLGFNPRTYDWIAASLGPGGSPVQLRGPFINLYLEALSAVEYSLSRADRDRLDKASSDILIQQGDLLQSWRAAFGEIPRPLQGQQPIDAIIDRITRTWADPATSLRKLQTAPDLTYLLNRVPASGEAVLPVLATYLAALNRHRSLVNQTTMNPGYWQRAMAAAQSPRRDNGGMEIGEGDWRPAFAVATPLQEILRSLDQTAHAQTITHTMKVKRLSAENYSVTTEDGTFSVPAGEFLCLATDDRGGDLFRDHIVTNSDDIELTADFSGVTMVHYGPVPFSKSSQKSWYWMTPIREAIKNRGRKDDFSGYRFSPDDLNIDFARSGPFGYLTGVAISRNPSLVITCRGPRYQTIARAIEANPEPRPEFLGAPLAATESLARYAASVTTHASDASVRATFVQPVETSVDSLDSTAFVLGVQPNFPAA